jgi:hypothetical protein
VGPIAVHLLNLPSECASLLWEKVIGIYEGHFSSGGLRVCVILVNLPLTRDFVSTICDDFHKRPV